MCTYEFSADSTPPHELLARVFNEELGVDINPQALRMLVRSRWDRITRLAHLIHDGK